MSRVMVGSYHDAYKAELCEMMSHLEPPEIRIYAGALKLVGKIDSNDHEILDEALAKYTDNAPLVNLRSSLESIAGVEYKKHFSCDNHIRLPTRALTEAYTLLAKERGYKESLQLNNA